MLQGVGGIISDIEANDLEEGAFLQSEKQEKITVASHSAHDTYTRALEDLIRHLPLIALVRPAVKNGPVNVISAEISALGYRPEDFSSGELTYEDIIDPEELPGVMLEIVENAREGAYGLTLRYRVKTKSGEFIPAEDLTSIQRNERGEPAYYITVITLPD